MIKLSVNKQEVPVSFKDFYELIDVINSFIDTNDLEGDIGRHDNLAKDVNSFVDVLSDINGLFFKASSYDRIFNNKKNSYDILTEEDFNRNIGSGNIFNVVLPIFAEIKHVNGMMLDIMEHLKTERITIEGNRITTVNRFEDYQMFKMHFDVYGQTVSDYIGALFRTELLKHHLLNLVKGTTKIFEPYAQNLMKRHTTGGVNIYSNPIITDVAINIYENINFDGGLDRNTKTNDFSRFSTKKATILIDSVKRGFVDIIGRNGVGFLRLIVQAIQDLDDNIEALQAYIMPRVDKLRLKLRLKKEHQNVSINEINIAFGLLKSFNIDDIIYNDRTGLLTIEEKEELRNKNEVIGGIVHMIECDEPTHNITKYVLDKKLELNSAASDRNNFYVCKIGAGNQFLGEAPGQLTVVPGVKPSVNINDILGSGFDEVKNFIKNINESVKFYDLFLATSPSKRADKSNALLVGPPGCGKTEILRALASDPKSISVFVQASDFLTCWKGEAEKNPKRLFEAGLGLQRESGKHVFFLIDEIDAILNGDRGQLAFGGTNLATEFQVLMDGVASYSSMCIWGATNNPERIPVPLLRRFSKVLIVGELNQEDRINMLKHYSEYLPLSSDISDEFWADASKKLEGAVGDTIRKIVDHVWREKVGQFVMSDPINAEILVKELNSTSKFSMKEFSVEKRKMFINKLRKHVSILPEDIMKSVDLHLNSIAIITEISSAVETYAAARAFLSNADVAAE